MHLNLPASLESFPWEYLANEEGFFFNGRENFLIRAPSFEEKIIQLQKITPPVKVLVIISNPPDLPEEKKLDVIREKRLIKEALRPLMDESRLTVKWEDEASLEKLQDALLTFNPHIIHYTGHGGFDEEKGGVLLLEDGRDKAMDVSGTKLAERLVGRDVRLIVLSGCQTAMTKTNDPFSSVAGALVKKGIPSVIAMQQSIRDDSANIFASRFYKALATGQPIDIALGEARLSMERPSKENPDHSLVDWGIPVLISSVWDLNLFALDAEAPLPVPPAPRGFNKINLPHPGDIFVGRQIEQRLIARALGGGDARCIMIIGPGGIGKSSLAARAVEQSEEYFHAVLTIGCKSAPTAEQILIEINTFLKLNGNTNFDQVMKEMELPEISQKIDYLPQELNASRYLIIFDNFENMLDVTKEPHVVNDEMVRHLLETLTINLRESRILITSRQDFDFTGDRRYQGNILPIRLPELTKMEAFRLMENIHSLRKTTASEKLLIFEKVGGNPFILDLVADDAKDVPIGNVLTEIKNTQKEFVEKIMLNRLYEWLPNDGAKEFFRKASVYRMPVNQDFLVAVGGDDESIGYLLHKSLLSKIAGDMYEMHTNTRTFASEQLKEIDGLSGLKETQTTAAKMYENTWIESGYVEDLLEARWFYYAAGDYNKAGELANLLTEPLHRWGFVKKVKKLNEETVESAKDRVKATALNNLGTIFEGQGMYEEAVKKYQESLKISEDIGDNEGVASCLYGIGVILQNQGNYGEALELFQQALKIREELKDKSGISYIHHQMGRIYQDQGKYKEAEELFMKTLKISEELNDKKEKASSILNLGEIYDNQGRYEEALEMFQESLKISEELEDLVAIAKAFHEIGRTYAGQGKYEEAVKMYQKSLKIKEELGDKKGIVITYQNLANIHIIQGRYEEAMRICQENLKISEEMKDKIRMVQFLIPIGSIYLKQRRYDDAMKTFQKTLKLTEELKDQRGKGATFHQIGTIYVEQGSYEEAMEMFQKSLKISEELNDKDMLATNLLNMGNIHYKEKNYKEALRNYVNAYGIFSEINSPNQTIVLENSAVIQKEIGEELVHKYLVELDKEQTTGR